MSDSERKLRIDAVARALRKFGLVDDHDNTVTRLLLRSRIPRVQKVTAAVSRLDRVPKGASKHIALTVIADVRRVINDPSMLPPTEQESRDE